MGSNGYWRAEFGVLNLTTSEKTVLLKEDLNKDPGTSHNLGTPGIAVLDPIASYRKVKKENQKKAQKRIFVEHVIRLIKIFKVARERFRLKESNYEKVILTICGLVRLRIGALMLT